MTSSATASRRPATTSPPDLRPVLAAATPAPCSDCGAPFILSAEETRPGTGLPAPTRCPACRARRREERNADRLAAFAAGPAGPATPPAAGPENGAKRLHHAVCATCRRDLRLPFHPSPDRPAYCRACLEALRGR